MGIYSREHACSCVSAGSTYGPGFWLEKRCNKAASHCALVESMNALDTSITDQENEVCNRLGISADRLAEIRGKKK